MEAGSSITLEGRQFSLLQFHFHLPSEHTVEGESYPMEVHFVHQAEEGDLAVIGIFIDDGEAHAAIQSIWDAVPGVDEAPAPLAGADPNAFLPEQRGYSRYAGSLTTPPCSEVASWMVMTESISVSQAQIDAFAGRCCTNRHWPARGPPTEFLPADAIRRWSAEGGHPIEDLTAKDDLTPLPGWTPGAKAIADDGFVSEERHSPPGPDDGTLTPSSTGAGRASSPT